MSISSIGGSQAATIAALFYPGGAGAAAGTAGEDALIANVEAAAASVSAALQSIGGSIGTVLDVTA